jgi:predicted nucleic acid-binding protein
MPRIYLDSSPVIYLVEQIAPFSTGVRARLSASGVVCVSSDLTRMECLVLPLRNGDTRLVADFDTFFSSEVAELALFPPAVFRRAAEIRAQHNFRTPDALHLAAAVEAACDVFLTNDAQLTRFTGLTVEVV